MPCMFRDQTIKLTQHITQKRLFYITIIFQATQKSTSLQVIMVITTFKMSCFQSIAIGDDDLSVKSVVVVTWLLLSAAFQGK